MKNFLTFFSLLHSLIVPGGQHMVPPQKCEINVKSAGVYVDQCEHFTLAYPVDLHPEFYSDDTMKTASFMHGDGPWIMSLQIRKTNFASPLDWFNDANKSLSQDLKMTVQSNNVRDGMTVLTLNAPIVVDHDMNKPIYDYNREAVLIRNNQLYTFMLREQIRPSIEKDFDHMVSTFHFYD